MNSDNPKIQTLLTLGQPKQEREWPDYLEQYGFSSDDVSALIALYGDEALNALDTDRPEVWAQLYAWRILGQLRAEQAIAPIIQSFDTLFDDDYALVELAQVIGMIGPAAIPALTEYWLQPGKDEFSYVMAMDALCEVATQHPTSREQIISIYLDYMTRPMLSAYTLNGLLIGRLLELNATETIDAIRQLFASGCVDISCAGDLEEVEIELGFRTQRSTPQPTVEEMYGIRSPFASMDEAYRGDEDDIYDIINHYLLRYAADESILSCSELDGFFAAVGCAPQAIMPTTWMPAIWGGHEYVPEWENEQEVSEFIEAMMEYYNSVVFDLQQQEYEPLFMESNLDNVDLVIVDEWCEGFMRGLSLWGVLTMEEMQQQEDCVEPIRLFCGGEVLDALQDMSDAEIQQLQSSIQPKVNTLYRYFFKPVKTASTTFIHSSPKVGRNEPCPCGSGRKHKKCCGLN